MTSEQFSRPGAIDLSGLSAPDSGGGGGASRFAVDISDPNDIQQVAEASLNHVVVLSLWSARAPASVQVNELLTRLSDAYEGRFLLARVDVDAAPQVAQALGAQGVPHIVALLRGQPVAQVPPTTDEAEARAVVDQLVQAAVANGVTGRAQPQATQADEGEEEPASDPRFAEADEALAAGDLDGAIAAYQRLVEGNPSDSDAQGRLAGARLMRRTKDVDANAAREAAAASPDDIDAQLLAADLDVVGGHVDDAFTRLIDVVRRTAGDERDRVRQHLLELFEAVGPDDPRVPAARRSLSAALF